MIRIILNHFEKAESILVEKNQIFSALKRFETIQIQTLLVEDSTFSCESLWSIFKCNLQSEIVSSLISQVMMWTHLTIFLSHSSLSFIRTFPWIIPYCPSFQFFHGLFLNASHLTLSLDLGGTGMQHIQVINHAGSDQIGTGFQANVSRSSCL